jgi:hypothetical protein
MTNLNRNLVEAYKIHLFEAVSREMMVEPSAEPQGPPLERLVNRGIDAVRGVRNWFQDLRTPAAGLDFWIRELLRLGKLTTQDLQNLFRDINNGKLYMLQPDGNTLREIEECSTCPSGWKYVEDSAPISIFGKKPQGLQQYNPNMAGDRYWGGWGKPQNEFWRIPWQGAPALPFITNPDIYPDWDLDGDGIPDNIQSQQYM